MQPTEPPASRRSFLTRILAAWAAMTSLPFLFSIAKFVYPPPGREQILDSVSAGGINDIPTNGAKIIRFNRKPVVIVRTANEQFKAFSAVCTHLGCVVEYKADQGGYFQCNCHGSTFDMNGKNIRGPASIPLPQLKVSIKDASVMISLPTG